MARDPAVKAAIVGGVFAVVAALTGGVFAIMGAHSDTTNAGRDPGNVVTTSTPPQLTHVTEPIVSPPQPAPSPQTTFLPVSVSVTLPPTTTEQSNVDPGPDTPALPASLAGSWKGLMVQPGNIQYGMAFTLDGAVDATGAIGQAAEYTETDYGSVACAYTLSLGRVTSDAIEIIEQAQFGSSSLCISIEYMFLSMPQGDAISALILDSAGNSVAESVSGLVKV